MNLKRIFYPGIVFLLLLSGFILSSWRVSALADPTGAASAPGVPPASNITWSQLTSPVTDTLRAVALVSPSEGWAAGENGTLLTYNGSAWITTTQPLTYTLFSFSLPSAEHGWLLGVDNTFNLEPILLRWDGAAWQNSPPPDPRSPYYKTDLSAPDDTHAWITSGILVCSSGPPCVPDVSMGKIYSWTGSAWSESASSSAYLSSISMVSATDGWAVGTEVDEPANEIRSVILRWDGSHWSSVAHPVVTYTIGVMQFTLQEITALDASTAWASVSNQNTILHWDGTDWSEQAIPVAGRPAITALSSTDAWAVGAAGAIAHWDGSAWTLVASPVTDTLTAIAMLPGGNIWAIGEHGVILYGAGPRLFLPLIHR